MSPSFLPAFQQEKRCFGGIIRTITELESLRFCEALIGGLIIEVDDASADFTALHYIRTIEGCFTVLIEDGLRLFQAP